MKSIWMEYPMPHFAPLGRDIRTDVLIIGGGMAGILCAHQLQKAGAKCVVAEAAGIGSGITQNTTAKLTSQHGLIYHKLAKKSAQAAGQYLQANERALYALRELCSQIDCDFREQDHFIYSVRSSQLLLDELETLHRLGFPADYISSVPLPFPTQGAVRFPNQAQFHPLKFLSGISQDLTVFENTPVRRIDGMRAITDGGSIEARAIIVATHFPFLNKHGSYFLKMYQQRSYVLALKNAPLVEGMYLDEQENGLSFRSFQDTLLLGGSGHRTGCTGAGWQPLEQFAQLHFPEAIISHRWANQDCITLDGIPYIGQYSARTPGLYVATGFNKWGMTSSMAAAQILTNLICGKKDPCAAVFSPSRSMASLQLAKNMLSSGKNLLTPTVPRCPHLGCALKWNPQEHSWDCPCHGSRFSGDGKLLDNPATIDLPSRE